MVREKSHRVQSHLKHTTTAFEVVQGYRLTYTGLTQQRKSMHVVYSR